MSAPSSSSPPVDKDKLERVLATDCGSTTTKAILIEKVGGEWRQTWRGEAPTTVEAPFEDVTRGVLNGAQEVAELSGRSLVRDDGAGILRTNGDPTKGVSAYISTSSAGGGLQLVVGGVVLSMTAESAMRAALGAGAIVMDTFAANDRRKPFEQIERIRQLRPDMILLAGGIDGGTRKHVVALAEMLKAARPRTRLGGGFDLPIIYAGNQRVTDDIERILGEMCDLKVVPNVRPVMESENLGPARDKIHDLFMEHVMAQAPGYDKLMRWVDAPIMPTPGAVGLIMQTIARQRGINVLGVDIGGATTDVFSVFDGTFNRTVSANLGMSYSVSNVLAEAGLSNILRWVPFDIDEKGLRNRIGNKMIRPTTIPQTLEELKIEQAIAREALRLAFIQHKEFATDLKGVQQERTIADAFRQTGQDSLVKMQALDLIVGSGGVLSHAPRRVQSMRMMMDAYEPEWITEVAVDSIFMMPHLGVLSSIHEEAATEVFEKDCLIFLGTAIAATGEQKPTGPALRVQFRLPDGTGVDESIDSGRLRRWELSRDDEIEITLTPLQRRLDVGEGPGKARTAKVRGGVVGLVVDTRGRPIHLPDAAAERVRKLQEWVEALGEYGAGGQSRWAGQGAD
ncbi:MAG: glutamate mutase L [Alphaproteobacteria bacterium]|nr:glutamate mutase L [Alphaproteobacteria bacterium]